MCLNHKRIRLVLEVELLTCHPLCYSFALDGADEKDRKELTRCKFWMVRVQKSWLMCSFCPKLKHFSGLFFFVTSRSMHSFHQEKLSYMTAVYLLTEYQLTKCFCEWRLEVSVVWKGLRRNDVNCWPEICSRIVERYITSWCCVAKHWNKLTW